jgi:hypothetical protein
MPAPSRFHGDPLGRVLWQGRQWSVTEYGIECRDGSYHIDKKRLRRDQPLAMACAHDRENVGGCRRLLHRMAGRNRPFGRADSPTLIRKCYRQIVPIHRGGKLTPQERHLPKAIRVVPA